MGMSKGQKQRLYGNSAAPSTAPSGPSRRRAPSPSPTRPSHHHDAEWAPIARPDPQKSSSGMIVVVLFVIAALMFAALHAWMVPQLGAQSHVSLPELQPFSFPNDAATISQALGEDGRSAYTGLHWSWGLFTPIFIALAWCAMIGRSMPRGATRWALWSAPLAYLVTFLAGNAAIDAALTSPEGSAPVWASILLIIRWIVLLAMLVEAGWLAVRLVRSKFDAFSRGELEGQQPLR
ncbi:hypothetical protein M4D50_00175 [Rothia sp. p3-SID1597]|nr:hypothetical protein [Rothia sp. p3-SID1597]